MTVAAAGNRNGLPLLCRMGFQQRERSMAKEHKGDSAPRIATSKDGDHGGNRAGEDNTDKQPPKSSQAAGKDPHRGKG